MPLFKVLLNRMIWKSDNEMSSVAIIIINMK